MHTTLELIIVAVGSFCSGWMFFLIAGVCWLILLGFRHELIKDVDSSAL